MTKPSRIFLIKVAMALAALVVLGSAALAVAGDPYGRTGESQIKRSVATLVTPVLSPRRVPALVAQPVGERRLVASLDALWGRHSRSSCLVVAEGSRVLYSREPDQSVTPASALKLVTGSVVLRRLGPDTRLSTTVRSMAKPRSGVIDGNLWLVGGGDPVLATLGWADERTNQPPLISSLETLADRVVAAGIREVRGRVLGDDSRYDQVRSIASWPPRYLSDNEVGPLSALSVNDGFAAWEPELVPFADPPSGAASVFTDLLRARGVVVLGEPGTDKAPRASEVLALIDSPSIAELVTDLIRESDNGTAELLVKELGLQVKGDGSTTAGLEVIKETLGEIGLSPEAVHLVDGSGLDPTNRLSCSALQALALGIEAGGPIDRGLAIAGFSGTLTKRFIDNPAKGKLRAKTGSLNHVAALVGRVEGGSGTVLVFTQVNNAIPSLAAGRSLQEDLGASLARYPDIPSLDRLGPLAPLSSRP